MWKSFVPWNLRDLSEWIGELGRIGDAKLRPQSDFVSMAYVRMEKPF